MDPSSPEPPNEFKVKKPACLGELMTSGLSLSSPGRAAIAPSDPFPINRRARGGGVEKGIPTWRSEEN